MEQSNGQTGHKEVDNSSSDEIDLELQDDETQVNQECPQEQQVLSHLLEIGEYIDYLDSNHNKWLTMKILDIQTTNIRLLSPTTQNTFWIQFQYHIIRKQWIPGVPLQNTRVEIFHHGKGWLTGIVLQVEQDKAYIHHQGYKRIYDDYYSIKDIYPLGYNSNEPGIGKLLKQQPQSIHRLQHRFNLYLQLQNLLLVRKKYKEMETSLQSVLNEQGMVIREVQGDGNCMFRAISDQLYGNEMYHKELRKFAMQYILQEKDYFQDYIVNKNVEEYVEYKSKDGVWGDNIELQAFRELYDIPIEIYVCSKEPLKTGLESNPFNKEPIRLSYHGRSHYNSIKQKDKQHSALLGVLQINQYEKELFERFQEQKNKHGQQISRAQFENCISNELDIIFNESKRLFQDQQLQNEQTAIKESLQQLEYEEEEEQLMDMIMKESVQDAEFQQQEKLLLQVKQEQPQQQQQQQQQKQQQQQQQQQYQQQSNLENEILKKIMEQSKQEQEQQFIQQIEDTQFQTALKESEKNLYEDPLNNPTIAQVMTLGYFTLEQVLEGYAIHRDDPEMIINYLYENFQ